MSSFYGGLFSASLFGSAPRSIAVKRHYAGVHEDIGFCDYGVLVTEVSTRLHLPGTNGMSGLVEEMSRLH